MSTESISNGGPLHIVSPMIMEIRASIVADVHRHVRWSIGYAPETDAEGARFILANLHAVGDEGFVEVEIGASQIGGNFGEIDESETALFEATLAEAESLSVIYDLARITAKGLSGTIDSDIALPLSPPTAEFTRLVCASDAEPTPVAEST